MKRALLFLCIFILPLIVSAADPSKSYWVIGSFNTSEGAKKEVGRLDYWITQPIRIAAVKINQATKYRLLVSDNTYQSQMSRFETLGIKPWKTKLTPSDLDVPMVTGRFGANLSYVLVLAGFRDEAQANQHAEDLRKQSKAPVDVVATSVNDDDYYRVVAGPYDAEVAVVRDQFVLMGIDDAWWLDMPRTALVTRVDRPKKVVVPDAINTYHAEESNSIPVVEASIGSIPDGTVMRAPLPQESYVDYCVNKANSAERGQYCRDGKFVSQSQRKIEAMGEAALFKFCATEAAGNERRQYCKNGNLSAGSGI